MRCGSLGSIRPSSRSRAVGVCEQHVVVLGQEARRRRRRRVGQRRAGHVEQLAPGLVGERHEPRPQPLEHRAQPGEAGPRAHVGRRRRPERGEVTQHDRVAQLLRAEAVEPRPQRDVRVRRLLRLHPDEPLDRLQRRPGGTHEQTLARQQGAVERAVGQRRLRRRGWSVGRHRSPRRQISLRMTPTTLPWI
jgi:hypothetical protein